MCNTFEQKRLKFNKIITADANFYDAYTYCYTYYDSLVTFLASANIDALGVPSSPAAAGASPRRSLERLLR